MHDGPGSGASFHNYLAKEPGHPLQSKIPLGKLGKKLCKKKAGDNIVLQLTFQSGETIAPCPGSYATA
jgi:hypothetical protein